MVNEFFEEKVICNFCKKELNEIQFTCKFCNETFCGDHRLPEKHKCEDLKNYNEINNSKYYSSKFGKKKRLAKHFYAPKEEKKTILSRIKSIFKKN